MIWTQRGFLVAANEVPPCLNLRGKTTKTCVTSYLHQQVKGGARLLTQHLELYTFWKRAQSLTMKTCTPTPRSYLKAL